MALRRPTLTEDGNEVEAALRDVPASRRLDGLCLLPGALVLLGFHVFVIRSEAFVRLPLLDEVVFALSLVSCGLSSIALAALARVDNPRIESGEYRMRRATILYLMSMGTLAIGLAGDLLVVGTMLSGSALIGELAAAALVLVLYPTWR